MDGLPTIIGPPRSNSRFTHPDKMVDWLTDNKPDADRARRALSKAKCEGDMQKFLLNNPRCLVGHLGGGHGRWVLPQFRLGSEYVADFILGERHSFGHHWQLVELECPTKKMFNKNGAPSATLTQAIRQIQDWRSWLHNNQNYAAKPLKDDGLGLIDIVGDCSGLILIGRRHDLNDELNARRRQMMRDLNIQIRTYDFLCERGGVPIAQAEKYLGRRY